jgi:hypothetical protein
MEVFMAFINQNLTLILSILLGLSETLALVPSLKSNSVFELVINIVKILVANKDNVVPPAAPAQ